MKIEVIKDFRNQKVGFTYEFESLKEKRLQVIVGENGCGKSSIFHALRGSLPKQGASLNIDDWRSLSKNVKIKHNYDKILFLDGIEDDGRNMNVSYSATNLIKSGGLAKNRLSHGQGSISDIDNFLNVYGKSIIAGKTLIVLDEVDGGLSLAMQVKFYKILTKIFIDKYDCDVIVISHNPLLMMQVDKVYDFSFKREIHSDVYIEAITGYSITKA